MVGGIELPEPRLKGELSVEEALAKRRSRRRFTGKAITDKQLSNLLWAAQGVTEKESGFRASPSAGAVYPLTLYVVLQKAAGLAQGIYRYLPESHSLELSKKGWFWKNLQGAAMDQRFISEASVVIVVTGDGEGIKRKYGKRGRQYMLNEVGHVGQNLYLACEAMGLGTVAVGAFEPADVESILGVKEEPLYLMPVGTIE